MRLRPKPVELGQVGSYCCRSEGLRLTWKFDSCCCYCDRWNTTDHCESEKRLLLALEAQSSILGTLAFLKDEVVLELRCSG